MKISAHNFKSLLVAWLCLVTALDFKAAAGFVLCLGEDGHIELENAVEDKCGGAAGAAHSKNPVLFPVAEDHCGDCLDVRLSGIVPQSMKHRSFDYPMSVAAVMVPAPHFSQSFPSVALSFP